MRRALAAQGDYWKVGYYCPPLQCLPWTNYTRSACAAKANDAGKECFSSDLSEGADPDAEGSCCPCEFEYLIEWRGSNASTVYRVVAPPSAPPPPLPESNPTRSSPATRLLPLAPAPPPRPRASSWRAAATELEVERTNARRAASVASEIWKRSGSAAAAAMAASMSERSSSMVSSSESSRLDVDASLCPRHLCSPASTEFKLAATSALTSSNGSSLMRPQGPASEFPRRVCCGAALR
mmetsp:Transcript_1252/g.4526  ORF Transcript_1252/g.4526 Transcript_1252/m.4526 type:complete len:238 (+) Transcript_1252:75-788(+)